MAIELQRLVWWFSQLQTSINSSAGGIFQPTMFDTRGYDSYRKWSLLGWLSYLSLLYLLLSIIHYYLLWSIIIPSIIQYYPLLSIIIHYYPLWSPLLSIIIPSVIHYYPLCYPLLSPLLSIIIHYFPIKSIPSLLLNNPPFLASPKESGLPGPWQRDATSAGD